MFAFLCISVQKIRKDDTEHATHICHTAGVPLSNRLVEIRFAVKQKTEVGDQRDVPIANVTVRLLVGWSRFRRRLRCG